MNPLPQLYPHFMTKKSILMLLPAAALLISSCGSGGGQTPNDTGKKPDSLTQNNDSAMQSEHLLPSPLQVAVMYKKSGMKYLPGLTNDVSKASNYSTKIARAQAMGVYSSDMAYCVLNKQTQDAQKYMKTVREIAGQIDLGKVFDNSTLYDRFNANLDKEDSLMSIVADIQMETDMLLSSNQQDYLYGVIYSAAWIESMHVGGQVYQQDQNMKIAPTLIEQLSILGSIVKELKAMEKKDPAIPGILAQMTELQTLYMGIPAIKTALESEDVDFSKIQLKKEELDSLIKKIEEIRTKIVNG